MKRLHKQTRLAIAYVQDALTFLFIDEAIPMKIKNIFLFGSAVRAELTKESDIDIFIDCNASEEKIMINTANAAIKRFYLSKDHEKWKHLNFSYPLTVQAGEFNTWQLKKSILAEGIVLYGKTTQLENTERKILITFNLPKNKSKYLQFTRKMFGRKDQGYKDKGLLEKIKATKISSNTIIVPKEYQSKIIIFLNREKINYTFKEISLF